MRTSIGTGLILIALGAILAFAVRAPGEVEKYVDVLDFGLILVWSGILVLIMEVVMGRPYRPQVGRLPQRSTPYDEPWESSDVHRPGYAGQTQKLPVVRTPRGGSRR